MRFLILSVFCFISIIGSAQGLFGYFKLTADGDGAEKFDRIIVDFTWTQWMEQVQGVDQGLYSFGISAIWMKDIPLGKRSNIALGLGLGFDSHNFHHNGEFEFTTNPDGSTFTSLVSRNGAVDLKTNKYALNYVDVPFELRLRTMNKTTEERMKFNFRFYLGFKAGILVNDHLKISDNVSKRKIFNLPNTLPYRYGPTLRIGFNKISFVGFYSLTSVFKENKGTSLTPFNVGVSWMRF
jgi:hypothetical protein